MVIGNNLGKLRKMPRIPFFDSHGEGVDVLVQKFEQTDGLDDGLVLPIDIQSNFVSGKGMGKTQPGLLEFNILEFFMFEEAEEVFANSTD